MNATALSREDVLDALEYEHGLDRGYIYLLSLIPLIEMVWADGKNQETEQAIVYHYVTRHLMDLTSAADGQQVVTGTQLNEFLDRFLNNRPSPKLLRELRHLAEHSVFNTADSEKNERRKRTVLEYCMDIAAAAASGEPGEPHQRLMEKEKALLLELMGEFDIHPHTQIEDESPAPASSGV